MPVVPGELLSLRMTPAHLHCCSEDKYDHPDITHVKHWITEMPGGIHRTAGWDLVHRFKL